MGSRVDWIRSSAPPWCISSEQVTACLLPQFSQLQTGDSKILWGLNELLHIKHLEEHFPRSKCSINVSFHYYLWKATTIKLRPRLESQLSIMFIHTLCPEFKFQVWACCDMVQTAQILHLLESLVPLYAEFQLTKLPLIEDFTVVLLKHFCTLIISFSSYNNQGKWVHGMPLLQLKFKVLQLLTVELKVEPRSYS